MNPSPAAGVELLRCERGIWRAGARVVGPRRARTFSSPPKRRASGGAAAWWTVLYLVVCINLIALAIAFGTAFWLVAVAALVLGVVIFYLYVAGTAWWIMGAGQPMLAVRGGVVHGRIRPVAKDDQVEAAAADWWDFIVPAADVTAVRLTGTGRRATLALDLPAEDSERLRNGERTQWYATRWVARTGTPAVWSVGYLLRSKNSAQRLHAVVAELEVARAAQA
jgi:hypothetical protein